MKQHQKVHKEKDGDQLRKKTLNEVQLVENITRIPRVSKGQVTCNRITVLHLNCKTMHTSNRILLN